MAVLFAPNKDVNTNNKNNNVGMTSVAFMYYKILFLLRTNISPSLQLCGHIEVGMGDQIAQVLEFIAYIHCQFG